jgi:hypothetical protein
MSANREIGEAAEARLKRHLRERAEEREAMDAARAAYERRIKEPWPIVKKARPPKKSVFKTDF